jgi:hypothetical protein
VGASPIVPVLGDPCDSQAVHQFGNQSVGDAATLVVRIDGEFGPLEAASGLEALNVAGEQAEHQAAIPRDKELAARRVSDLKQAITGLRSGPLLIPGGACSEGVDAGRDAARKVRYSVEVGDRNVFHEERR